jgi:hypothetical protein
LSICTLSFHSSSTTSLLSPHLCWTLYQPPGLLFSISQLLCTPTTPLTTPTTSSRP